MLLEAFLTTVEQVPTRRAIRDSTREVSYEQLARLAATLKRFIESQTDRPHVGILLPSTAGFAASFYGALWAGRTVVPLNFLLQPNELKSVVEDSGIDLILTCEYFADAVSQLPARSVILERSHLKRRYLVSRFLPEPRLPTTRPDDLAVLLYTSGTTGAPRGVCLTHDNLNANVRACIQHTHMTPEQVFLGVLPLFHAFGLTTMLLAPTLIGATVLYQPRFQPAQVLSSLVDDRVSIFMATPSMYAALAHAKTMSPDAFRSVHLPISGGEPLPMSLWKQYRNDYGVNLLEGYGMSETSPVISTNLPWKCREGTVGTALPNVQVAVRNDRGETLLPGEQGEICIRGPSVMRGYYNKPADTAAILSRDGWLRSGDLGRLDADGFLSITGRIKDLIIVGGENVFPREIEAVLEMHPGVAESCVIGMPDASRGEVVVGFVVPREGASVQPIELREHCRDYLAGYKVPRRIFIDQNLPRGPTGKVLKRALRERLQPGQAAYHEVLLAEA